MPFKYSRHYETVEDVRKEFGNVYKHPRPIMGCYNEIQLIRERKARHRQEYLDYLNLIEEMAQDEMITRLQVDLSDPASIRKMIEYLQGVLNGLPKEPKTYYIPFDPTEE